MKKYISAILCALAVMVVPCVAFAADAATAQEATEAVAAVAQGGFSDSALKAIAAAFAICIASALGAIAQSKVGASALDGIARNPGASGKMFVPMLLVLAFIESLVLYAFLIALMIK